MLPHPGFTIIPFAIWMEHIAISTAAPYTQLCSSLYCWGFVISLENKDVMCIKALALILSSKALDRFFETISSCHHHFLQKVHVMDLHDTLQAVTEFVKWVQSLPSGNLQFQIDEMSTC